jgi:hypothetical protein
MTAAAADRLEEFIDPVHLHQVRIRGPRGGLRSHRDLTPALLARWRAGTAGGECRIHFHVPLYARGHGDLGSTAEELTPAFFAAARAAGARHFEIETYTFAALPHRFRLKNIAASIAREYRSARAAMGEQ